MLPAVSPPIVTEARETLWRRAFKGDYLSVLEATLSVLFSEDLSEEEDSDLEEESDSDLDSDEDSSLPLEELA